MECMLDGMSTPRFYGEDKVRSRVILSEMNANVIYRGMNIYYALPSFLFC